MGDVLSLGRSEPCVGFRAFRTKAGRPELLEMSRLHSWRGIPVRGETGKAEASAPVGAGRCRGATKGEPARNARKRRYGEGRIKNVGTTGTTIGTAKTGRVCERRRRREGERVVCRCAREPRRIRSAQHRSAASSAMPRERERAGAGA